jgi:hypothetical protein
VVNPFPDFIHHRQGGTGIWVNRQLASDELWALLKEPDALFAKPDCEIVKDQLKIKVARVKLRAGGEERRVYVKRYNVFSWHLRLISLVRPSRAVQSLCGARILVQAGIATALPVAATERRSCGMLVNSFFLSEEIAGGKTVDAYWRALARSNEDGSQCRRRDLLRALALLFRRLHDQNVYHNDLKDANILVAARAGEPPALFLLDLEGIRRYRRLNRRRRVKNLVQLNRTLGLYVRRLDKCLFLKYYLGDDFADRECARRWIADVLKGSHEKDRRKPNRRGSGRRSKVKTEFRRDRGRQHPNAQGN